MSDQPKTMIDLINEIKTSPDADPWDAILLIATYIVGRQAATPDQVDEES